MVDDIAIEGTYLYRNKWLSVLEVKGKGKLKNWRNGEMRYFTGTDVSTNTNTRILKNKKSQTRTTPVRVRY